MNSFNIILSPLKILTQYCFLLYLILKILILFSQLNNKQNFLKNEYEFISYLFINDSLNIIPSIENDFSECSNKLLKVELKELFNEFLKEFLLIFDFRIFSFFAFVFIILFWVSPFNLCIYFI